MAPAPVPPPHFWCLPPQYESPSPNHTPCPPSLYTAPPPQCELPPLEEADVPHEEQLLRDPYSVRCWLRYLRARQGAPRARLNLLYERALRELPGRGGGVLAWCIGSHWVLLGSIGCHWVPLGSIGFHWVPLGAIGFD
uniref:Pre-mRNA-splicing factor Syf1-like N-terminal HAT-repeats domain-containing protein n=1 Tax=Coturnix japonica TaxID=93934 RepID=A0A8C2Y5V1_COTJA